MNTSGEFKMTLSWSFAIAIALSIMLATLPVMISIVQTSSVEKQRKIICSLDGLPVSRTEYYRIAMYYIRNVEPATLNSSYRTPILFFSFVVLFLSSMTFMGTLEESYFRSYSVILGAMHTI